MECVSVYIEKWDWNIVFLYDVTVYDVHDVKRIMVDFNADRSIIKRSIDNINNSVSNFGITFTNYESKSSLTIIGNATSCAQFSDTLQHEIFHLSIHISKYYGYDFESEKPAYIAGDIAYVTQRSASKYLCECCKGKRG